MKQNDGRHAVFEPRKPRRLWVSLGYRAYYLLRRLLPPRLLFRWLLKAGWLLHRFTLEQAWYSLPPSETEDLIRPGTARFITAWVPRGSTVIDLGGGRGLGTWHAAQTAGHVLCVDRSETSLAATRARCRDLPNVAFSAEDFLVALQQQGPFDVALMLHVLGYFEDTVQVLRVVRRKARRLLLEVPDYSSDPFTCAREREGLPSYSDCEYRVEFDGQHLRACLEQAGWRILAFEARDGCLFAAADAESATPPGGADPAALAETAAS